MLDYRICKKLKEIGFPQEPSDVCHCYAVSGAGTVYVEGVRAEFLGRPNGFVHIPNLSELIEACGDGFWSLNRTLEGTWFVEAMDWCETVPGNTAEEAVANLYLALHGSKRPN